MTEKVRLKSLDFIRGIAASLVMVQHTCEAAGFANGFIAPYSGLVNLGQAGVVAFFLVSGFVIPMSLERSASQAAFWLGRAFRLYPMYLVAFVFSILLLDGVYDFKTIIAHVLFVQDYLPGVENQVPNSWTLSIELAWYVAASVLFAVGLLNANRFLFWSCLISLVIVGAAAWFLPAIPAGRFALLVSCVVGMLMFRTMSGQSNQRIHIAVLFAAVLALIACYFRMENGVPKDRFFTQTILAAWIFGYALFFLGLRFGEILPGKILFSWLGQISYSVYLVHSFLIKGGKLFELSGLNLVFFVFAGTLLIATICYNFIELPAIRWGRRIVSRRVE